MAERCTKIFKWDFAFTILPLKILFHLQRELKFVYKMIYSWNIVIHFLTKYIVLQMETKEIKRVARKEIVTKKYILLTQNKLPA